MVKKIVITLLVLGAVVAGVLCTGYATRNAEGKWFAESDIAKWHWSDPVEQEQTDDVEIQNTDNE